MSYDQGDIVLVLYPQSDLSASRVRPAIVVSNIDINQTSDVILAQITTNLRSDDGASQEKLNIYSSVCLILFLHSVQK